MEILKKLFPAKKLFSLLILALLVATACSRNGYHPDSITQVSLINLKHKISDLTVNNATDCFNFRFAEEQKPSEPAEGEKIEYQSAYDLFYNSETEMAATKFSEFIKNHPDSPIIDDAYNMLGCCYRNLDEHEYALDTYASAIIDFPNGNCIAECYYNIAYIYKFKLNDKEKSIQFYIETLKHANRLDREVYYHALQELKDNNIKVDFGFNYKILDSIELFDGGIYGDVLVNTINKKTPKEELEDMFTLISIYEGFLEMSLYRTEEAYKSNFSESFLKSHPNALDNGYVGSINKGKITYWNK